MPGERSLDTACCTDVRTYKKHIVSDGRLSSAVRVSTSATHVHVRERECVCPHGIAHRQHKTHTEQQWSKLLALERCAHETEVQTDSYRSDARVAKWSFTYFGICYMKMQICTYIVYLFHNRTLVLARFRHSTKIAKGKRLRY